MNGIIVYVININNKSPDTHNFINKNAFAFTNHVTELRQGEEFDRYIENFNRKHGIIHTENYYTPDDIKQIYDDIQTNYVLKLEEIAYRATELMSEYINPERWFELKKLVHEDTKHYLTDCLMSEYEFAYEIRHAKNIKIEAIIKYRI